MPKTSAC